MSRYLWLLRHAKTLSDPPPGGADRERRLAERGQRDAVALGKRLAAGGLADERLPAPLPELVLSSSAVRTTETAQLLLGALADAPPLQLLDSLYAAPPAEVVRQVARVADDLRSVMVVGHNPTVRRLAVELVDEHDRRDRRQMGRRSFGTCGLAVYAFDHDSWAEVTLGSGHLLAFAAPPY